MLVPTAARTLQAAGTVAAVMVGTGDVDRRARR